MKTYKKRNFFRWVHLIGAALIGIYVYSPFSELFWFQLSVQAGVIPILSLSGFWLWKPHWFQWRASRLHLKSQR